MQINHINLFQMLPKHELEYINKVVNILHKNKNDTIFLEGEDSDYLHMLLEGTAKVYRVDYRRLYSKDKIYRFSNIVAAISGTVYAGYKLID